MYLSQVTLTIYHDNIFIFRDPSVAMDAYQNGEGAKEAEFQRIAQNISTNIQKISQNGE